MKETTNMQKVVFHLLNNSYEYFKKNTFPPFIYVSKYYLEYANVPQIKPGSS